MVWEYVSLALLIIMLIHIIHYPMFRKIDKKDAWKAFVPVLNQMFFLKGILEDQKKVWLFFVPVVNLVFLIIWWVDMLDHFRFSKKYIMIILLPIINVFFILYIGLTKKIEYHRIHFYCSKMKSDYCK